MTDCALVSRVKAKQLAGSLCSDMTAVRTGVGLSK